MINYKSVSMKNIIVFLFFFAFISCNSQEKRVLKGESEFQKKMNADFKDASKSPLTKRGLKEFKGLNFFPINNTYKVLAKLTKTPDEPFFNFPTTTDRVVVYKKYGEVFFTINGKELKLDIYKSKNASKEYKNHLFLPFLDKTSGDTSYGGGRFVDVLTTDEYKDGTILIDFNKAYNPYCAYNKKYSCPITPRTNYIDVAIEAGVMKYEK